MKLWWPVDVAWKAADGMSTRNGFEIAGYIAFTVMLSLFPFMIFLVSIAGFFGDTSTGENFLNTMAMFAPPEVMKTLLPAIQQVTQNRSGGLLSVGLALSLYSAASAVAALRLALNLAYGADEARSFLLRKAQDFLVVFVGSILLTLLSIAIILGPWLFNLLAVFTFVEPTDKNLWYIARYGFSTLVLALGVITIHRVLPNVRLTMRDILPGALTTTIAWIVSASLLTVYFDRFGNYDAVYGSLGGAIVSLLFFYVSAIIFIYGGELNGALLAHAAKHAPPPNPELRSSLPTKSS